MRAACTPPQALFHLPMKPGTNAQTNQLLIVRCDVPAQGIRTHHRYRLCPMDDHVIVYGDTQQHVMNGFPRFDGAAMGIYKRIGLGVTHMTFNVPQPVGAEESFHLNITGMILATVTTGLTQWHLNTPYLRTISPLHHPHWDRAV